MLHRALEAFAFEARDELAAQLAGGAELPFELVETGRRARGAAPLYCYRPLTGEFIARHLERLWRLPTYEPAVRALGEHAELEEYLAEHGARGGAGSPRARADAALLCLLEQAFTGRSDLALEPAQFAAAYAELERALYEARSHSLVLAPLLGLELAAESSELVLGDGLSLVRGDVLPDAPAEAAFDPTGTPRLLAVLSVEDERAAPAPPARARARFRRLLTALRLYERGDFAIGPLAWSRRDGGAWRSAPLGGGEGGRTGAPVVLPAAQQDELRAFCNLVARRMPDAGETAWALARFEMGCERASPLEALSDHLLALRALLEPEGPASARLAQRLAVICATDTGRAGLAERAARAIELERAVIAGRVAPSAADRELVDEMSEHLRAILRDVVCGHLGADVRELADEILAEAAELVAS